jgi:hypothetical protein
MRGEGGGAVISRCAVTDGGGSAGVLLLLLLLEGVSNARDSRCPAAATAAGGSGANSTYREEAMLGPPVCVSINSRSSTSQTRCSEQLQKAQHLPHSTHIHTTNHLAASAETPPPLPVGVARHRSPAQNSHNAVASALAVRQDVTSRSLALIL